MVNEIYGCYGRPLVKVVHGETSWNPIIATTHFEDLGGVTAWSPCNRFIAVGRREVVEIRDAATLMLLNTLKSSTDKDILRFSPDSRLLTEIEYKKRTVVTWDLQTGSSVYTTLPDLEDVDHRISSTYSTDGKMLAVAYSDIFDQVTLATHELSTTRTHLYRVPEGLLLSPIWTHGEFLRFATMKPESITIWQVEFTMTHPPEAVESFPTPDEIADANTFTKLLFLPSPSRLAVILVFALSIWDVRYSKLLLDTNFDTHSWSFSSDGCFFACVPSRTREVHLWKESPTGYVLHQKIAVATFSAQTYLSPNGESILISDNPKIHLRHTKYPILPNRPLLNTDLASFTLVFSPDNLSAAFARFKGKTVTVLDLQSGDPQLEIDTDMEVRGLGVTGSAIVVVGEDNVGNWSLTAGEAGVKFISNIVQKKTLGFSQSRFEDEPIFSLVSPDLSRIIISGYTKGYLSTGLNIYDASTGSYLAGIISDTGVLKISSLPMLFMLLI